MLNFILSQQTWWEWINYWLSQDASNWHPLAWAFDNNPIVIGIHLIAGTVLAAAFYFIGLGLAWQSKKQGFLNREHKWVSIFFITFLMLCGTSFVIREVLIFVPIFWIYGAVKIITSLFAFLTALTYAKMLPYLTKQPSLRDFAQLNKDKLELEHKATLLNEHISVWTDDVGQHINILKGQQKELVEDLSKKGVPVTTVDDIHQSTESTVKSETLISLEKMRKELESLLENVNKEIPKNQ